MMLAHLLLHLSGSIPAAPVADLFVDASADCAAATGSAALPFCTIGEAIAVAVAGDVIHIAPGAYPEELTLDRDVELRSSGLPASTIVDGQNSRNLLTVESGATVVVDGLWFRNGSGFGGTAKGCVLNRGSLTLRNSTISNSRMIGCCGRGLLYDESGSQGLTLEYCTISSNYVNGFAASLLRSYGTAGLVLRGTSVLDNYVYLGPTIRTGLAPVEIDGSYFESSRPQTGAVIQVRDADLVLRNTTITDTAAHGLDVYGDLGYQLIESSTLDPTSGRAARVFGTSAPRVRNSVLAEGNAGFASVVGTFTSLGNNLVASAPASSSGFTDGVLGDRVGTVAQPLDPMLASAADNGGPTWTRLPMQGSPLVDAGHSTDFPPFDQNGFPRVAGGVDVGAAELPIGLTVICTSVANSTGDVARLRISGSGLVAANALELFVDRAPAQTTGMFLTSNQQGFLPNPGGSAGNLCLGGNIGRFVGPGQVQTASTEGTLRLRVDLTSLPQGAGTVSAMAGQGWAFQCWFRDFAGGVPTSNFSTAQGVVF